MKLTRIILASGILMTTGLMACRSPEEKVHDEKVEAQKEIGKAAENVRKAESDAANEIASANDAHERTEAKIDATEDLARAQEKLRDEKAEATEEIAKAEATAGHGGTYEKK